MDPTPNPDEAAAIAAAVERFRLETASAAEAVDAATSSWQRAALVEGVGAKEKVREHREGGFEWLS